MLTKVLHTHLDGMDNINKDIQDTIDMIFSQIDIKEVMVNPEQSMHDVVEEVRNIIIDKYQEEAVKQGLTLVDYMKKRDIKVSNSDNPTENKELANA